MTGCSIIFRTVTKNECNNNCIQDLTVVLPLPPVALRSPDPMVQLGTTVGKGKGSLMTQS